jgi:hypothetical protein
VNREWAGIRIEFCQMPRDAAGEWQVKAKEFNERWAKGSAFIYQPSPYFVVGVWSKLSICPRHEIRHCRGN